MTVERSRKGWNIRVMHEKFRVTYLLDQVNAGRVCPHYVAFRNARRFRFQATVLKNALFLTHPSSVVQQKISVGCCKVFSTASCPQCRALLGRERTERLHTLLALNLEQDNKVVRKERF